MTTEFLQNSPIIWSELCNWFDQPSDQKIDDQWILPIFQSENYMTTEFLWNFSRMTNIPIWKSDDQRILMKF